MKKRTAAFAALVALTLSGCSTGTTAATPDEASEAAAPAPAAEETARTVTYDVTSDGATAGNVTYLTFNNGGSGQEQATDAALPFSKVIEIEEDGMFETSIFSLTAQAAEGATTISCKITVDGQVISEQTSTGQYAVVSCSGTPS